MMLCGMAILAVALHAQAQQGPRGARPERADTPSGPPPAVPIGRPGPFHDAGLPQRPVSDRMTPDERRQLRRDIDQHGRELYRSRRAQP